MANGQLITHGKASHGQGHFPSQQKGDIKNNTANCLLAVWISTGLVSQKRKERRKPLIHQQ